MISPSAPLSFALPRLALQLTLSRPWTFLCNFFVFHRVSQADGILLYARQNTGELSDNELAALAQSDLEYFSDLFDRFFQPVYRFFYFRLRHHDDAEDLTSETFEKIFRKLDTFEERGLPFSAWVFSIAHHCLIDHVRKKKVQVESIDELTPQEEPSVAFDLSTIERSLLSDKLWNAIRTLPRAQQQMWALKLSADLPHAQIADILGTTENNVNVMVHRSCSALKKRLAYLAHDAS